MRSPPKQAGRLALLDAMRGFALCGILLVNLPHMAWLVDTSTPVPGTIPGSASGALWWVQMLLVEGTMRGLFSLLFGASLILFMTKAEEKQGARGAYRLMNRRLGWLFAFGVVNASILLWPGDILIIYALAGFLVLPFWRVPPRVLAAAAAAVVIALSLWSASGKLQNRQWVEEGPRLEAAALAGSALAPAEQKLLERWREWDGERRVAPSTVAEERAARLGPYDANLEYLSRISWEWFWDLPATARWVLDAAALMLVGMLLYRIGTIQGGGSARTYWSLVAVGYGIGVPLKAIEAVADWQLYILLDRPAFWQFLLPSLTSQPARLLVTLGHLGVFVLVWRWLGSMRPLEALGRMAFTGYLLQSVLAGLAFGGFGLALWGEVNLVQLWLIAAAIWAAEIGLAMLWLSRLPMGPLEWLWRTLTYGRPPEIATAEPAPR